jgi:hypothetical protein
VKPTCWTCSANCLFAEVHGRDAHLSGLTTKGSIPMPTPPLFLSDVLKARLCVLAAVAGMAGALRISGYPLILGIAVSCLAAAGAVEIGCRLTTPLPAPGVRVCVVIIVLVFVLTLIHLQYPWAIALGVVLGTALPATEIARRLTGQRYPFPRLSY